MGIFGKLKPFRKKPDDSQPSDEELITAAQGGGVQHSKQEGRHHPGAAAGSSSSTLSTPPSPVWNSTTTSTAEEPPMLTSSTTTSTNHNNNHMMMMSSATEPTATGENPAVHNNNPDPDEISVASGASENQVRAWDEGGSSDCGYSESLHNVFMCVGGGVHTMVGAPSDAVHAVQKSIGNWFQELSYATRDIIRGEGTEGMQEDAIMAVGTFVMGEDNNNTILANDALNNDPLDSGMVATGGSVPSSSPPAMVQQHVQ